jgi:hypothetical protein
MHVAAQTIVVDFRTEDCALGPHRDAAPRTEMVQEVAPIEETLARSKPSIVLDAYQWRGFAAVLRGLSGL